MGVLLRMLRRPGLVRPMPFQSVSVSPRCRYEGRPWGQPTQSAQLETMAEGRRAAILPRPSAETLLKAGCTAIVLRRCRSRYSPLRSPSLGREPDSTAVERGHRRSRASFDCRRGFARSGDAGSPVTRARWCERDLLLRHRSHHRVGSAAHRFGSIGGSERRSVLGVDVRDGRDDVTGDTGIFRTPASIQVSLGGGDQRRRAVDPEWSGHDARQAHSCAGACIVFGRRAHGAVKILRSRQQLPWGLMCVLSARWPMEICSANARR